MQLRTVTLVVVALDGLPVIAAGTTLIDRLSQATRVIADRRFGKAEDLGRLGPRVAVLQKLSDPRARVHGTECWLRFA
jgi:hypothetical protein